MYGAVWPDVWKVTVWTTFDQGDAPPQLLVLSSSRDWRRRAGSSCTVRAYRKCRAGVNLVHLIAGSGCEDPEGLFRANLALTSGGSWEGWLVGVWVEDLEIGFGSRSALLREGGVVLAVVAELMWTGDGIEEGGILVC